MDRLTAFVAIAHLKLRLEIYRENPFLAGQLFACDLEYIDMAVPTLPPPMEFAGLKSRLQRAKSLEKRAGVVGPRVDAALDVIETGVGVLETHAPELEKYGQDLMSTINGMLVPTNGGPALEGAENPTSTPATPTADAPKLGPNGGPRIL
jgi:hypothetical protein